MSEQQIGVGSFASRQGGGACLDALTGLHMDEGLMSKEGCVDRRRRIVRAKVFQYACSSVVRLTCYDDGDGSQCLEKKHR